MTAKGLLRGKVAIVTGAAAGIGKGVALELASEGAEVVLSGKKSGTDRGLEVVRLIEEQGGRAAFQAADVRSNDDWRNLIAYSVETFGSMDIAVNNAGVSVRKRLDEFTEEDYTFITDINLKGTFLGMAHQIVHMKAHRGGSIVNIASVAGATSIPGAGIYTATKHAIIGLTKSAAKENGEHGIRVNAVLPNAIRTPLFDRAPRASIERLISQQAIPRPGEPEEVGAAVAWLASSKASFVTGISLPVDGGYLA